MNGESKIEIPSECKTEEFSRFEKLARQLVKVPKKEIQDREKKQTTKQVGKPSKV